MAVNFVMFAGDTKLLQVSVTDGQNNIVDITGTVIRWELAKTVKDEPSLIYKIVGNGITIVDGTAGRFDVLLQPVDTLPLKGTYYYEAEIDDGGVVSTVLTGQVLINPVLIEPLVRGPITGAGGATLGDMTVSSPGTPIVGGTTATLADMTVVGSEL